MVEITCCCHCRIVLGENCSYSYCEKTGFHYCKSCYEIEVSPSETSSSDDDTYDKCYYCKCELEYDMDVFEDLEPCNPRYYCSSCNEVVAPTYDALQ